MMYFLTVEYRGRILQTFQDQSVAQSCWRMLQYLKDQRLSSSKGNRCWKDFFCFQRAATSSKGSLQHNLPPKTIASYDRASQTVTLIHGRSKLTFYHLPIAQKKECSRRQLERRIAASLSAFEKAGYALKEWQTDVIRRALRGDDDLWSSFLYWVDFQNPDQKARQTLILKCNANLTFSQLERVRVFLVHHNLHILSSDTSKLSQLQKEMSFHIIKRTLI